MRELKILIVLVVFTLVTYYGIEPFAHSNMHAHVEPANFDMDAEDTALQNEFIKNGEMNVKKYEDEIAKLQNGAKDNKTQKALSDAQKNLESAKADLQTQQDRLGGYQELWEHVNRVSVLNGDAQKGAETFTLACASCHGLKAAGVEAPFDDATASESYGVAVPDLSDAGAIYDKKFLAGLIINPPRALKLEHKFNDDKPFPMTPFGGINEDFDQDVADIVAYLQSVAPANISGKQIFENACLRCHDMRYDKLARPGMSEHLIAYAGSNPPDLSIMIRSRGQSYLDTFINDPQKNIPGTAMPRVGLNEESQDKLVAYMEQVGDSKKDERQTLGIYMMIFFAVMAVFAYLWKQAVWKDLH